MKVILSRKGFDSEYGCCASPVLPDGTMISLPIPSENEKIKFSDLFYCGKNYYDIWNDLNPNCDKIQTCHLDPDIRKDIMLRTDDWRPAFGQISSAQGHLINQNVKVGDIFLFFGRYQKTDYIDSHLKYINNSQEVHAIYGYLQIGEILYKDDVKKCPWHPHSEAFRIYKENGEYSNNAIYLASDRLVIDGKDMGLSGAGTFKYSDKIVLTADEMSITKWKLNNVFNNAVLSYHNESCKKEDYFQSRSKGQEFVFEENQIVTDWLIEIIKEQKVL